MGLSEIKNFSKYHRMLSRTQWNSLAASKILFGLLINLLPEAWPKIVAVDETLERRRDKVKGLRIQLRELLADPSQTWQMLTVKWYGGEQRTIECLTFECLWYHAGELPLKLRIVLVKTPGGGGVKMYFSTSKNHENNMDSLKITEKNANLLIYQLALAA